jgi:hypothetical protein
MSSCAAMLEREVETIAFSREHRVQRGTGTASDLHQRASRVAEVVLSGSAALTKLRKLQPKKVSAEKILQAFNTWAFKREQPSDAQAMLKVISDCIATDAAIPFCLYWGKGPRGNVAAPDIQCLDYLAALAGRVRDIYAPGVALKLICTDTHARLNGHPPEVIKQYFDEVTVVAKERGFDSCWLGDLVQAFEASGLEMPSEEALPEETLTSLHACAEKWYRGEGSAKDGALKYYQMNMVEKRAVEYSLPGSIFVTFNSSEFRSLFPDALPIFYMYSLKKGVAIKPWFLIPQATVQA